MLPMAIMPMPPMPPMPEEAAMRLTRSAFSFRSRSSRSSSVSSWASLLCVSPSSLSRFSSSSFAAFCVLWARFGTARLAVGCTAGHAEAYRSEPACVESIQLPGDSQGRPRTCESLGAVDWFASMAAPMMLPLGSAHAIKWSCENKTRPQEKMVCWWCVPPPAVVTARRRVPPSPSGVGAGCLAVAARAALSSST